VSFFLPLESFVLQMIVLQFLKIGEYLMFQVTRFPVILLTVPAMFVHKFVFKWSVKMTACNTTFQKAYWKHVLG
jgi:hypothetical protein